MTYAKDIAILFALFLVEMISAKVISEGRNFLLRTFLYSTVYRGDSEMAR